MSKDKPLLARDSKKLCVICDNEEFRKTLIRDLIAIVLITVTTGTGIVVTLFLAARGIID